MAVAVLSLHCPFPVPDRNSRSEWSRRETVWIDGSRQDGGRVGAADVWRTQEGWTGRRYHLGTKEEASDAETFAIYQALRSLGQCQEDGYQYTVFVDSTAAIDRVRSDALGPGQRFAVAAIEACSCIRARDNDVTIRWVPALSGASVNEVVDECAGQRPQAEPRWTRSRRDIRTRPPSPIRQESPRRPGLARQRSGPRTT